MQLVDDHVDNSSANSSIDTHSNVEPSNHESFKKANGLPVCPLKHLLNDSFADCIQVCS